MWYHISKKYLGKRKKLTPKVCDYNSTNIYQFLYSSEDFHFYKWEMSELN